MTFNKKRDIIIIVNKKDGDYMLSQDIITQIKSLHSEHHTYQQIAEELQISIASVRKYVNEDDITKKKNTKITPEMIEQINQLYSNYHNQTKVARELNISPNTVRRYLNEDNLKITKQIYDDRDALYFYVYRLFGQYSEELPVDPWNVLQMAKFVKQGYSYKTQLLTLKYFYEVKHNRVRPEYKTIGIIPSIYYDAKQYYLNLGKKQKEIAESIQRQLEKDRIEIHIDPGVQFKARQKKKKRKEIDLNSIVGDEE